MRIELRLRRVGRRSRDVAPLKPCVRDVEVRKKTSIGNCLMLSETFGPSNSVLFTLTGNCSGISD